MRMMKSSHDLYHTITPCTSHHGCQAPRLQSFHEKIQSSFSLRYLPASNREMSSLLIITSCLVYLSLTHIASDPTYVSDSRVSWEEAKQGCIDIGSTLLTLSESEDGESCYSQVSGHYRIWVGAYYDDDSGNWLWAEDESVVDLDSININSRDYPRDAAFFTTKHNCLYMKASGQLRDDLANVTGTVFIRCL